MFRQPRRHLRVLEGGPVHLLAGEAPSGEEVDEYDLLIGPCPGGGLFIGEGMELHAVGHG